MVFQCINIRQVTGEVLKTAASGLGFQHLHRDLANVNAWKTMFGPYIASIRIHMYKRLQCKTVANDSDRALKGLNCMKLTTY